MCSCRSILLLYVQYVHKPKAVSRFLYLYRGTHTQTQAGGVFVSFVCQKICKQLTLAATVLWKIDAVSGRPAMVRHVAAHDGQSILFRSFHGNNDQRQDYGGHDKQRYGSKTHHPSLRQDKQRAGRWPGAGGGGGRRQNRHNKINTNMADSVHAIIARRTQAIDSVLGLCCVFVFFCGRKHEHEQRAKKK